MSDLIHEGPKDPNKPPVPGEEKPTTERERMKKVYTYVAILFTVAFLLILWTFLMNQRSINEIKDGKTIAGKTVVVSGSGNVAIYAVQKITEMGAKVVAMSDSNGYIHDPDGIKLDIIKDIKLVKRGRIKEYAAQVPGSTYTEGFRGIWTIPCDIALPCATQNEITAAEAEEIVKGGAMAVAEGANMPSTPEAIAIFQKAGLLFAPAKAANAGGVAVSALEMSQNSMRYSWTFEEVDAKLQGIMVNIFHNINNAAKEYGMEGNLVAGANLAGFKKVSEAMIAQRLAVSRECWRRFCP